MIKKNIFAITQKPTPVFNCASPNTFFGGKDGKSLLLDEQNLMRCIETVLLPYSKIKLVKKILNTTFWKVETEEYPYPGDFYVEESFIQYPEEEPKSRSIQLPRASTIVQMADALVGTSYIWGGNWPLGIPSLMQLFPSQGDLSPLIYDTWQLKGVDCSGLLYFLSDGYTPRNTSRLLFFKHSVEIEKMDVDQIVSTVKPLDLIVYKGHVIIVLNPTTAIESKVPDGVVKTPLKSRLLELMETKSPLNDPQQCSAQHFVIRRWHPDI